MKRISTFIALAIIAILGFNASAQDTWSLVGAFNSWANADTSTEFVLQEDGTYKLTGVSISAGGFKVIKDHAWTTQYGSNGSSLVIGQDYTLKSNGDNIVFANSSATYTNCTVIFTVNDSGATLNITGTEEAAAISSWCLCGEFNNWDITNAPQFTSKGDGVFELTLESFYGEFGIYADNSWNIGLKSNSAGDYLTLDTDYVLGQGSNLRFENKSTVYSNCTFTLTVTDTQSTLRVTSTGSETPDAVYALTGAYNNWVLETNYFTNEGNDVYTLSLDKFSGDFKITVNTSWDDAYGSNGEEFEAGVAYILTKNGTNVFIKNEDSYTDCKFTLTEGTDGSVTLLMTGTSGVDNVVIADGVKIVGTAGAIKVTGADDVQIYTVGGALVGTEADTEVAAGMYIVKAGDKVQKVVVR